MGIPISMGKILHVLVLVSAAGTALAVKGLLPLAEVVVVHEAAAANGLRNEDLLSVYTIKIEGNFTQ